MHPFHYSFKIKDIDSTREFYGKLLGCKEGRSTEHWIDFDFFGHQMSAHIAENIPPLDYCGLVDGIKVPIPHFGVIISVAEYVAIREKLETINYPFIVKPQIRYAGKPEQQHTFFILDASGNPLEFKSYSGISEQFI
ncbi:MAG: extradiol dioxygenase family protein [Oceanospirillaceae bacterium]|jgi:extradiol dioxygenase family protein